MPDIKIQENLKLNIEKQMVPCRITTKELTFEWLHHRISSPQNSKVRTTLHVSIVVSESEKVKEKVILVAMHSFTRIRLHVPRKQSGKVPDGSRIY